MNKTNLKNLLRDIKKTISRFLSIVVIIAVGVAFYAGVRATSPDMKRSADYYFNENNLMDFKVISTLGLTKDDLTELGKQPGISMVEGSYSIDAVLEKDKHSLVLNINSIPAEKGINEIKIVDGRMPESNNEAIVEDRFLRENKLNIGDEIELKSGKDTKIEDSLKNSRFTIVGTAKSPLYLSAQRQLSSVGNGTVRGFVYIMPDVFKSDVYTEAYVRINNDTSKESLIKNDDYKKAADVIESSLKDLGTIRSKARYDSIMGDAQSKIKEAEDKLNASKTEAADKFSNGYKQLEFAKSMAAGDAGRQQAIDAEVTKLKAEEDKANASFKDAEAEIQKNKDKLNDIKAPVWYILGRSSNVGYETYRQDSERISNIGKAFPLIFFLVAALVSLTTMTRLVQENRTEIGTFKALGYSRLAIVSHYLIYSLSASLTGSLIGLSFAFKLFPSLIMNAYTSLYAVPYKLSPFNFKLALEAAGIAVLFTAVASVTSTLEELRESPASLMRPKPPKNGKRILLERFTFIWKRLTFTQKVTARNIFRYKQRFFMTVIGIAACTGLMITGFGLKGGVIGATQTQFNKIYKYDMLTTLTKTIDEKGMKDIKDKVMATDNMSSVLFAYLKNGTVKTTDSNDQDAYIVVPEEKSEFNKYIDLNLKGKELALDDNGVILTQKLSKMTGKKVGDTIDITLNDKVFSARVSAVTEHYLAHYIYISPDYYQKITGEKPEYNEFYGLLKEKSQSEEDKMSGVLSGLSNIGSVNYRNNAYIDINKSMDSINSVVLILIISAGVLAFVVIYNLTNINISERKRELATIKLLGFYNKELASYIYRENIILTIIGSFLGIFVGKLLNTYVLNSAETNVLMFLRTIEPSAFIYSIIMTIIFSVIVNLAMYGKFEKIDMIESLKSAE